jgi:toxin FitB
VSVVGSAAWLAYFAGEPNAQRLASAIEAPDSLIVPSITLLEVFKKVAQQF